MGSGGPLKFIACTRFRLRDLLARAKCMKKCEFGSEADPTEGWFHEPRSEAESALRKKKSRTRRVHSHAHAYTCACRRVRTHAYAPAGFMKSTHPKGATTEAKRGHEKHNRTLTPAHTCDRVKIVRAESAPRMRTPAVSSRARARIYIYIHAPKGCMYPHPKGAV